jgi:hypothetical protein
MHKPQGAEFAWVIPQKADAGERPAVEENLKETCRVNGMPFFPS